MPWRQVPMKDVEHCDKPRVAVCRRSSGDVRMGKPTLGAQASERIGGVKTKARRREPGGLKHLNTPRKRDHSASSGERTRISPNQPGLPGWGCRTSIWELPIGWLIEWC